MHELREMTGLNLTFEGFAKVFKEIATFIAEFFAEIKNFAAGFEKTYAFEAEE